MKKKIIIISVVIILVILLFPIRNQLKDGGTVEYKALVYKVSKVHKRSETYHEDGIKIEILGKELFNNVKAKLIEKDSPFSEEKLGNMALEYFFKTTPEWTLDPNASKDEYHLGMAYDIEKYQKQDMVVIEIRHIHNNINNTLDARYYINIYTAKGFDDSGNEIDLNL